MEINEIKIRLSRIKNFDPYKEFNRDWIKNGIDEKAIDFSSNFGFYLCNYEQFEDGKVSNRPGKKALTNSQIRNVFGEVKRIQMKITGDSKKWTEVKSSFLLLQPKLAYATGRVENKNRGTTLTKLKDVLIVAAQAVQSDKEGAVERYENFVDLLESILAYHKAYGGKEN